MKQLKNKQRNFDFLEKRNTFFGGSLLKNSHAKKARPLSIKNPIHMVLRSTQAKGIHSFLTPRNSKIIKIIIHKASKKFHIRVIQYANAGNHLHIMIRGYDRREIKNFLRTVTALIARYCQNRHKGSGESLNNFWDQRPFTRIIESFKGYLVAKDCVLQNALEALGIIPYKPRNYKISTA